MEIVIIYESYLTLMLGHNRAMSSLQARLNGALKRKSCIAIN